MVPTVNTRLAPTQDTVHDGHHKFVQAPAGLRPRLFYQSTPLHSTPTPPYGRNTGHIWKCQGFFLLLSNYKGGEGGLADGC